MKPDVILHSRTFHIRVLLLFSIEERHIKICSIEVESIQYLYDASFIHHINKHQLNMTSKKKKKKKKKIKMGMQIHQILLLFWFTKQLRCDVKGCMFHYFNK